MTKPYRLITFFSPDATVIIFQHNRSINFWYVSLRKLIKPSGLQEASGPGPARDSAPATPYQLVTLWKGGVRERGSPTISMPWWWLPPHPPPFNNSTHWTVKEMNSFNSDGWAGFEAFRIKLCVAAARPPFSRFRLITADETNFFSSFRFLGADTRPGRFA